MRPPLTGMMFTDADRQTDCPRCGQKAGSPCRIPSGPYTKGRMPHNERIMAMYALGVPQSAHYIDSFSGRAEKLAALNAEWTKE